MRKLRKPKKGKAKVSYQTDKTSASMVLGGQQREAQEMGMAVNRAPETVSYIASMINRSQEHNQSLSRLIERTRSIGDRMFGGTSESKTENDKGGPTNALGVLETQLMIGEQLACILLGEIQRLEVL